MNRLLMLGWLLLSGPVWGNGVVLSDLQLIDDQHVQVQVGWSHSWRLDSSQAPGNHDAVWVFAKYRLLGGDWQPLRLASVDSLHHSDGPLLEVVGVADAQGLLVRRSGPGQGNLAPETLTLTLASPLPAGVADLTLLGIELVYVPKGGFWLGDSSSYHHFRRADDGGPLRIDSEAAIGQSHLSVGDEASLGGDLPPSYPKGFAGFYIMKYELSQAQYRDFLNLLTYEQQAARTVRPPSSPAGSYALAAIASNPQRNGLVVATPGGPGQPATYACEGQPDGMFDQVDDGQARACSFLNWEDLTAYLDWAGLRPLTELEMEKAARGPVYPLPGGFAWGTDQVVDANTLLDDGRPTETVAETATATAGLASHGYAGPTGPLRVGFGGSDSSDRLQIGGSYYGVLELSGNLWEQVVGVQAAGLTFTGAHGDGQLAADGSANAPAWPLAAGGTFRGGAHNSGVVGTFRDLAVSDRFYWALVPTQRRNTTGGRGGRTY